MEHLMGHLQTVEILTL